MVRAGAGRAAASTHFSYDAETTVDFSPTDERQFAGLTAYYYRYNFLYLTVTAHSDGKRELLIMCSVASQPFGGPNFSIKPVPLPDTGTLRLKLSGRSYPGSSSTPWGWWGAGSQSVRCSTPRRSGDEAGPNGPAM